MTLTDLLEEFNVVIDTPQGLTELRSLILGLAVRGKLVSQDPNDEPASELLRKIEDEKQRLYMEGEIRKPKKLDFVSDRELPFDIPESWEWCRLGKIYGDIGTTNPESKFSYIDVGSIDNSLFEIDYNEVENIPAEDAPSRARREVKDGSVVYSTVRPYLMNVAIVKYIFDFKPIASTAFEVINVFEGILNKYVYRYLLSDPFLDYVNFKMVGVAYPAINKGDMQSAIISIPPTAEQHRIVQRIETLFAEVDELEEKLNLQTKLDEKLQLAVNAEVQKAPDADASKTAWRFISTNFDTLYHTPEAIDNLKKNILNEAVRGRLVPQDPNDEPASELLKKIEFEKQRLYDEGEIRKPKDLPPVDEEEIPFEIPNSWEWCRFG
jgi:type I restriction enzyme S subunit